MVIQLPTTLKENELHITVQQIKKGDSAAFEKIYEAYAPALYGICVKILNDEMQAQDVLQDSFVKIWKNCTSFDENKGSFFTWMLNITRNTAIDKYRQKIKKAAVSIQSDEKIVHVNVERHESIKTNHIGIRDLLKMLPEEQQVIIDYLYFRGYTHQEASDELNLPLGTVKTRSRNALKTLGKLFILLFF